MLLFVLAYLGGVLTIVSPCILPVLPFVFARADRPFVSSALPMLIGMVLTFAAVATLAAVGGSWAVHANEVGRWAALALLAVFGLALLIPQLSEQLTRPLVSLGSRLSQSADRSAESGRSTVFAALLLGVATGLLWAPCAGPILGLILTGAALKGANIGTSVLLLAYAAGAATSLALALMVGGRVFSAMKRSLGAGEWVRRGLGAAVLVAVIAIAFGLDTGFLTSVSSASTASPEQGLIDKLHPGRRAAEAANAPATTSGSPATMSGAPAKLGADTAGTAKQDLPVEGKAPSLSGASEWINSPPLKTEDLKGKVVLVDFWTYSCINCLRALPYVRAWAEKYKDQGLVVIGVHAPEFAFEKSIDNVKKAVADLKIRYPVAVDNDYAIWQAFNNEYWPAHYFIDAQGRIRHHHFGEGSYAESEKVIRQLLAEAGRGKPISEPVQVTASGATAPADSNDMRSPETYVGYERAEHFASPGGAVRDTRHVYAPGKPSLNEWGLSGDWTVGQEHAASNAAGSAIVYRFHARDLHLVLGPASADKPIKFTVTVDGAAPGKDHGVDVDAAGHGVVAAQRLYQLVRQEGAVGDRTFEIHFSDPGVQAFAFTFG